jgi:hypothetical protein
MAARLAFAKKYQHWIAHGWSNVIWTDESSFEMGKLWGQVKVWHKVYGHYNWKYLAPTFQLHFQVFIRDLSSLCLLRDGKLLILLMTYTKEYRVGCISCMTILTMFYSWRMVHQCIVHIYHSSGDKLMALGCYNDQ